MGWAQRSSGAVLSSNGSYWVQLKKTLNVQNSFCGRRYRFNPILNIRFLKFGCPWSSLVFLLMFGVIPTDIMDSFWGKSEQVFLYNSCQEVVVRWGTSNRTKRNIFTRGGLGWILGKNIHWKTDQALEWAAWRSASLEVFRQWVDVALGGCCGQRLDLVTLEVFSNLNNSMLWYPNGSTSGITEGNVGKTWMWQCWILIQKVPLGLPQITAWTLWVWGLCDKSHGLRVPKM